MLVVILDGSSVSEVSDSNGSFTEDTIPGNELAASQTEASNASASVAIATMMKGIPNA